MAKLGPDAAYIFRITHVKNVPWILAHGIHCRSSSVVDPDFVPIGSAELIAKRSTRTVPIGPGGTLSDYVPFYFTPWSIMMYNLNTGYYGVSKRANAEIAILVSSLYRLKEMGADELNDSVMHTVGFRVSACKASFRKVVLALAPALALLYPAI